MDGGTIMILLLLPMLKPVSASTSMGKSFAVSVPRLKLEIILRDHFIQFHLFTFSEEPLVVHYKSSSNHAASEELHLKKGIVLVHGAENDIIIETGLIPTFTFKASENFGVTVYMLNSYGGAASFQAVPVSSWRTLYYVVTGSSLPFILIISGEAPKGNAINILFSDYTQSGDVIFVHDSMQYKAGSVMDIFLLSWQSYIISNCSLSKLNDNTAGLWDGTKVSSDKHVGVISGSCWTYINGQTCDNSQKAYDMVAEMLLPIKSNHTRFVFPNIPESLQPTELVVVTSKANANVSFSGHGALLLTQDGQIWKNNSFSGNYFIESDQGVLVLYMHSSMCHGEWSLYHSGPNLCIILPTRLFHYTYIWSTAYKDVVDFVLVVARIRDKQQLVLDTRAITRVDVWKSVAGLFQFNVANIKLGKGLHTLFTLDMTTFGCYIYGFGRDSSYMHWAGYQLCGHSHQNAKADKIDNDCDGRVDEEKKDGKDNDNDGLVDEDLNGIEEGSSRWLVISLSITLVVAIGGLIYFMVSMYKKSQKKAKPIGIPVIYFDEESSEPILKRSPLVSRVESLVDNQVESRRSSAETENRSSAGSSGSFVTKMSRRSSPVDDAYAKTPLKSKTIASSTASFIHP